MIYRLILSLRDAHYRNGRHSSKAAVPTVCVGNITAGGTGKTPHTEMLIRELLTSDKWGASNVAVLSRGYKRRSRGYQELPLDASAYLYGDEPAQIKHKFPGITVAVDKNRIEGCAKLAEGGTELVVLDDAYQYRKLKADLNIVLSDYSNPVSTDSLLPAGHLRDLKKRLYDSDIVIVTKCPYELDDSEKQEAAATLGYDSYDPSTCVAAHKGKSQLLFFTQIRYEKPEPVFPSADTRYIYSHKLVMFTGIANDTPLVRHLSDSYKIVEQLHFPDHHKYNNGDVRRLKATMKRNPTAAFATTEKDALRLRDLKKMPSQLQERLFYLPISVEFLSEREHDIFFEKLMTI